MYKLEIHDLFFLLVRKRTEMAKEIEFPKRGTTRPDKCHNQKATEVINWPGPVHGHLDDCWGPSVDSRKIGMGLRAVLLASSHAAMSFVFLKSDQLFMVGILEGHPECLPQVWTQLLAENLPSGVCVSKTAHRGKDLVRPQFLPFAPAAERIPPHSGLCSLSVLP